MALNALGVNVAFDVLPAPVVNDSVIIETLIATMRVSVDGGSGSRVVSDYALECGLVSGRDNLSGHLASRGP